MKIKKSQLEEIDKLVVKSEDTLEKDVLDKREVKAIAQEVDQILTSMGQYKRFFKRLA